MWFWGLSCAYSPPVTAYLVRMSIVLLRSNAGDGLASERGVKYKKMAAGGFRWDDLPYKFKLARVEEEKLKPKPGQDKHELLWVKELAGIILPLPYYSNKRSWYTFCGQSLKVAVELSRA